MVYPSFQRLIVNTCKMNIALSCVKYLLFVFNLAISLLGIAITVAAIWVKVDPNFFKLNAGLDIPVLSSTIYVAIVVGLLMLIVGFLGCCGAFQENKCMLLSYVIIVTILLIVQIVIAALILKTVNDSEMQTKMKQFLKKELNDEKQQASDFIKFIQAKVKCCGIEGPEDYKSAIPPSCYYSYSDHYETGCVEAIANFIKDKGTLVGGITLGAFFIQLMACISAVCLYCSVNVRKSAVV